MKFIKNLFSFIFCLVILMTFYSHKSTEKREKFFKTNIAVNLTYKQGNRKDSTNLVFTKKLYNEYLIKRRSNLPIDSIMTLAEKILISYENVEQKDITYAFKLYKDIWGFYEDIGDHANAIKCMEDFITFCNTENDLDIELILETYSVLINQLLYTGQCDKAIESVFIPAFNIIDNSLEEDSSKEKKESLLLSKINMQTPYLLCARHLGDGDMQRRILRYSEKLVKEKHDDILNYNLYKADLLGMMTSTYIRMGDLPKAHIFLDLYEKYMVPVDIIDDILVSFRKLYLFSKSKEKDKFYKELDELKRLYAIALKQFPPNTEEYFLAIGNMANALQIQGYLHENINPKDPEIPQIFHSAIDLISHLDYDAHINPLNAYDGLITFYNRKKQSDSAYYYLKKFKTIAIELNSLHNIRSAEIYTIENYLLDKDFKKVDSLLKVYLSQLKINNLDKALSNNDDIKNIIADSNTIQRLMKLADIFNTYSQSNLDYLKPKSNQLYILAAILLNKLKLNQGFNPNEIKLLKEINEGILATRVRSLENDNVIIRILEGNQSLEMLQKNENKDIVMNRDSDLKLLIDQREKATRKLFKITKQYQNKVNNTSITENETYLKFVNYRDSVNSIIREKYPKYVFYTSPSFDLETYRSSLVSASAVLRFYVTETKIYAYLITNEELKFYKLGERETLNNLIDNFTKSIISKDEIFNEINAIKTYLKPVFDDSEPYSIIKIIPHEELNFLPFETLLGSDFLNSEKAISYNSSLALDTKRNKKADKISIVAYAPKYSSKNSSNSKVIANVERSGSYELPNAYEEAYFITQLFDGRLFSGKDANKGNFIAHVDDYTLVHLAMHATVANPESNEEAMLLFSGSEETDYMSIKDIYNLQLSSNLTTLSACSTAYGDIDPVEGVLSLSRAFQYAGSDATLTSLWRVPDKETSLIMKEFYKNLKQGQQKNVALKNAKLHYLNNTEDPNLKHPYYWAGFILTGDTSAIIEPTNLSWTYGIICSAILLIIILIIKRRLKPKS
ncbi:CHAT domain-containing protein [uncultured Winogradskyella sp.]|uniref:CHAT domain-containing protein n=1 Tax=Winogradskyella sp. 4-2091 TaxID=3381659 RepID=UPI002604F904|nr:CHAT domain-containing protein [uncultured Winogradskyella sp.]